MRLAVTTLALLLALTGVALADGFFVAPHVPEKPTPSLDEPEQVAVITHDGSRETLALRVRYDGPLDQFAWILPFPSKPDFKIEEGDPFHECDHLVFELMTARYEYLKAHAGEPDAKSLGPQGAGPTAQPPAAVHVLETKLVGSYEIAVLESSDAGALEAWLGSNGYRLPPDAGMVLGRYIRARWTFVAIKVKAGAGKSALKPLRFTFDAERPVFPLRISSLNGGLTTLAITVLTLSNAGIGSSPLVDRGEHLRFSPKIADSQEAWTFAPTGADVEVTASLARLTRCPALVAGAPAFFDKAKERGADLVRYTATLPSRCLTTDLTFGDGLASARLLGNRWTPGGARLFRAIADAATDSRPDVQAASLKLLYRAFPPGALHVEPPTSAIGAKAREALAAYAFAHASTEGPSSALSRDFLDNFVPPALNTWIPGVLGEKLRGVHYDKAGVLDIWLRDLERVVASGRGGAVAIRHAASIERLGAGTPIAAEARKLVDNLAASAIEKDYAEQLKTGWGGDYFFDVVDIYEAAIEVTRDKTKVTAIEAKRDAWITHLEKTVSFWDEAVKLDPIMYLRDGVDTVAKIDARPCLREPSRKVVAKFMAMCEAKLPAILSSLKEAIDGGMLSRRANAYEVAVCVLNHTTKPEVRASIKKAIAELAATSPAFAEEEKSLLESD